MIVIVVSVGGCAARRPPPAPARQTSLALEIEQFELTNGLRVVLARDPGAPEVQVTMRYRVGAVDDPVDQAGIAHLVEHLMFQQIVGERAIFARLQDHASAFNAFTSFDATTFVARAHPDRLGELLSIDAVRLGLRCTTITESTFVREREVVRNEIRLRAGATVIYEAVHRALYPEAHPYRRIVGGTEQSVGAISREQACAFADAHYAPKSAVLVVSGPVTTAALQAALGKFFARIPPRTPPARAVVRRAPGGGVQQTVPAPVEDELVVVAWSLP